MLKTESISSTEEKRIVLGMIVSTEFVEQIKPIFKIEYFTNSYLNTLAVWCDSFFEEYNKAPYMHIKDIFDAEYHHLPETDAELIEILLKDLDSQYEEGDINLKYWTEMAGDYFRSRELEIAVNNISVLKEKGDLAEAEQEIENFKKVSIEIDSGALINPGDLNQQEEIYRQRDEEEKSFFTLPGDLGKYLGNQKRGDVVGYYGPAKKGKCASGDNLIYLSSGTYKTLKYVVDNKITNILCMNKDNKIVKGEVENWISCGEKQEFEIKTKTGVVTKVSEDHKYYTPDGWKKVSELKQKDHIALCKKTTTNPGRRRKVHKKEIKVLAYLIADGHLGPTRVSFTKLEKPIMNEFIELVHYYRDTHRFSKDKREITVRVGNITKLLTKLNLFGKLSGEKFIPDHILSSSNTNLSIFLNTLFTCDGSIYKGGRGRNSVKIEYSTKSKLLAEQIIGVLTRFGINGLLRSTKVNNVKYYSIFISNNYNINLYMKHIGFSFSKKEKAEQLCKNLQETRDYIDVIPNKFVKEVGDKLKQEGKSGSINETFRNSYANNKHLSRFTFKKIVKNHPQLDNDIMWVEIVSIKKTKKVPMYDLTVKENHNFIMNSCIVHNSFTLINQYKYGILSKRKTLLWSIEMTKTEVLPRVNKSFYPMINKEPDYYKFPVFDCIHNQTGNCADRLSETIILDEEDGEIYEDPSHTPCTLCMRHPNYTERNKYNLTVYQDTIYRNQDDIFEVRKKHKQFEKMWKHYGRLSVHKKYSLTYDKMMRDLDIFWKKEQWMPDILIIDYIDILDIGSKFDDYRQDDEKWKLLAKIAGKTNTLVITATQANKAGHTANVLTAEHQGGFYGKNRHVNLMVGLNQKPEDKEKGIMNFGITEARDLPFVEGQMCSVLQDFKTGQSFLDSYCPYL